MNSFLTQFQSNQAIHLFRPWLLYFKNKIKRLIFISSAFVVFLSVDKYVKVQNNLLIYNTLSFFTPHKHESPPHKLLLPPNHQFSQERLEDFSTGRYCAIKALEKLGIQDAIIPIGEDRAPIWPEEIVGSISHCDSLAGAIIAKSSDHISLGLDIEEIGRVTPDLWGLVFTENEMDYLSRLSAEDVIIQSTTIFSIKEAFYKFQHQITKTFLDFLDVEVALPDMNRVEIIKANFIITHSLKNHTIQMLVKKNLVVIVVYTSEKLQ
jgi:4'-phosphopantetheinyl transferase EntD